MEASQRIRRLKAFAGTVVAAGLVGSAGPALGAPITFNTALPVADDTFVTRFQGIRRERDDDIAGGREVDVDGAVGVLGYGFTRNWTGFAITPYLDKELTVDKPRGKVRRQADGLGDTTLLARYTAFERNAPGRTLRVAPAFGVVAPTGESDGRSEVPDQLQPGAGSWGAVGGVVVTRQTLDWEFDASLTATTRGRDEGFEPGDEIEFAASYQYRLPCPGVESGAFTYAVLETKGIYRDDKVVGDERIESSGTEWRITPGVQYVTRRWVAEAAVELPATDDLPDTALRDEAFWHVGVRFNF